MCYAKPGPRCSSHAARKLEASKRALAEAEASKDEGVIARARAEHSKAKKEYLLTPAGIKRVRASDGLKAMKLDDERKRLVALQRKSVEGGVFSTDEKVLLAEHGSHDQMMMVAGEESEDPRIGLALAKNGDDEVRDAVRGSEYVAVRRNVARLASDDVRRKMVDDEDKGVRLALAQYGGEETQELFLGNDDADIRHTLIKYGSTHIRREMFDDPDETVRAKVVKDCSYEQKKVMVDDPSPMVRGQVAAYGTNGMRKKLLKDSDPEVRRLAWNNLYG